VLKETLLDYNKKIMPYICNLIACACTVFGIPRFKLSESLCAYFSLCDCEIIFFIQCKSGLKL